MKRWWLLGRVTVLLVLIVMVSHSIAQTLTSDAPPEQKLWEVMLKALFPPIWTALSPLLTGAISTGMKRVNISLSPLLRYIMSTVIGTVTGAVAGTVDAFPLTSESAANMGATAGLAGQWLAERNPSSFGVTTPPVNQTAQATAKAVPVVLLALIMTGCVSLSAKVCTPESVTALMPESWPSSLKKACPIDLSYSNMTPESQQQTLRVIVPNGQPETFEVKPMTQDLESRWPLGSVGTHDGAVTLEYRGEIPPEYRTTILPEMLTVPAVPDKR